MVELKTQNFSENKKLYKKVEDELKALLGKDAVIDHVGSTAIPDMCGKNIIDVLVGAKTEDDFAKFKQLISKTYFASLNSYNATEIYQFFASKTGETGSGDVHIHLVKMQTERYNDFLYLRDYLLENKDEAKAYANHKKELVSSGITDRKEYRRIKSEYVSKLIERARAYHQSKTM